MDKNAAPAAFGCTPLAKINTGVTGLDEVLDGGYPEDRTTILKGGPGAGKTLLALQFLYKNALKGKSGIFISFEETADAIRLNAGTLGWDLGALEEKGLLFLHHATINPSVVKSGDFSLAALLAILDGKSRELDAKLLVIDAVDILMRRFEEPPRIREELNSMHQWLGSRQITALVTVKADSEPSLSSPFSFLDYLADCAVLLDHRMLEQVSTRRLRVVKYRGSAFGTNEYPYVISEAGVHLIPIASTALTHKALGPPEASGNAVLDEAMTGGYRRGSCVLIAGPSGGGKTMLACTFVESACLRGEKALYTSYEESPEALESSVRSAGIRLKPALQSGHLEIVSRLPESMGSDEHLFLDFQRIESFAPDIVVVDAMSACRRMGSGKAPFDYLMRLVNACKERGITCLLTNQMQSYAIDDDVSGLGFSSLVDTVIQLRFAEIRNEMARSLLILKARGSRHSHRFYDMQITDRGIVLACRTDSPADAEVGCSGLQGAEA